MTLVVLAAYFIVKYFHDRNQLLHGYPGPDSFGPPRVPDLEAGPVHQLRAPPRQCGATLPDHQVVVVLSYGAYSEMMSSEEGGARRSACGECVVCLGEFEAEDECVLLGECLHVFHKPCGEAWLGKEPSCPVCRARVGSRVGCYTWVRFGTDNDVDPVA
uniref:RING-type E3 ubiquitin transferase n=1 Tax=Kalanchoe fedtschenkoi TaxID=63787 RepID=A0A7N0RDL8_KALFE